MAVGEIRRSEHRRQRTGAVPAASVPAASVPAGTSADGLPLGVQLAAAPGGEALLLARARQLETLRPWPRHAPLEPLGAPPQRS